MDYFSDANILAFVISVLAGWFCGGFAVILKFLKENYGSFQIAFKALFLINKKIRFSMSYLFRIKIDSKYLLIKGNRINQYQPIGGVYKLYDTKKLREFNALDDKEIPIDEASKNDLRVRIPSINAINFLKWFKSEKDREISVHREFIEELVVPKYLNLETFTDFKPEYLETVTTKLKYSKYMKSYEVLVYDIYELELSDIQKNQIRNTIQENSNLVLVTEDEIERESTSVDNISTKIGVHAKYIL